MGRFLKFWLYRSSLLQRCSQYNLTSQAKWRSGLCACKHRSIATLKLRWPTTVTSKQNAHIKFKSLTSNSNHSQQIQITHSKFKLLTANSKPLTAHSNCSQQITNPPQQITNRSHQIQIIHIKYKSLTANTNTVSVKRVCGLRTADCGLRTAGLQTAEQGKSRLRVKCRLQTEGKMRARG